MTYNPAYEKSFLRFRIAFFITRSIIILSGLSILVAIIFMPNTGYIYLWSPVLAILLISHILFRNYYHVKETAIMVKHGLYSMEWIASRKKELNGISAKIAAELNIKPLKIEIAGSSRILGTAETAIPYSLFIPPEIAQTLNDKEIEFIIADNSIGFHWRILSSVYGIAVFTIPLIIFFTLIPFMSRPAGDLFPKITFPLFICIYLFLMTVGIYNSADKEKYKRILSVTRDYESAKSALTIESDTAIRKQFKSHYNEVKSSINSEVTLSVTGATKRLEMLHDSAQELGLID